MSDAQLHVLIAIVSGIVSGAFSAGIAWSSLRRVKQDVNAMGRKINDTQTDGLRRHHNVSMVLMLVAPLKKEHEICELLKEG